MCSSKNSDEFIPWQKMLKMSRSPKLFLYSLSVSPRQCTELTKLAGKEPGEIRIGLIENAADIIPNSGDWLGGFRSMLTDNGYRIEPIDLKQWLDDAPGLYQKLNSKYVIWLGGGHTYYLRWILQRSGSDKMIKAFVENGKVYAGWSAGAIVAGPTTLYFDLMGDDPADAPEFISNGLQLTDTVVVPHFLNPDYNRAAIKTNAQLRAAGFSTCTLKDNEVFLVSGKEEWVI
jgi:dipeptidase E